MKNKNLLQSITVHCSIAAQIFRNSDIIAQYFNLNDLKWRRKLFTIEMVADGKSLCLHHAQRPNGLVYLEHPFRILYCFIHLTENFT